MPNGRHHKDRKKAGRPAKKEPPTIEVVLGALWIKHEKYFKPMDQELAILIKANGAGEIRVDETRIFRFAELKELYEWLSVR